MLLNALFCIKISNFYTSTLIIESTFFGPCYDYGVQKNDTQQHLNKFYVKQKKFDT